MKFRRRSDVAWRRIEEEYVVVNLKKRQMTALNESGGRIFEILKSPQSPEEVVDALCGQAPNHGGNVQAVEQFLRQLEGAELVEMVDPASPSIRLDLANLRVPFHIPEITWKGDMTVFGASCAPVPIGGPPCDPQPQN